MPSQKVIKAGNSLAVTIPADIVKRFGLKSGDTVELVKELSEPMVKIKFTGAHQLSLVGEYEKKN